jgi:Fe-S-cluster formation regulator IscX/YfhJ
MNLITVTSDNQTFLTPLDRAHKRDTQARCLDGVLKSSWAMLGLLCRDVQQDRDWELLGHHSFDAWIEDALPYSRSHARFALSLIKDLSGDIAEEVLLNTPLASANVLRQLPKKLRQDAKVQEAATNGKPKEFREQISKDHPETHIELQVRQVFNWTESQSRVISETVDAWRVLQDDPEASYEVVLESLCAGWLDSQFEDFVGVTNREAASKMTDGQSVDVPATPPTT